jgi:hypothetical protein
MKRAIFFMTMWLCLWVTATPHQASAEQAAPALRLPDGSQAQETTPGPGTALSDTQSAQPAPPVAIIDPATGLPLTPEQLHDREIDKFDPLKRDVDPTAKDSNPLIDRKQPDAVTSPKAKNAPLPGSVAADEASATSGSKKSLDLTSASDNSESSESVYSGPAVLSRAYTLARPLDSMPVKWVSTFGFNYAWDDGEVPGVVNGTGGFLAARSSSLSTNWSLSGRHSWKRDQIGISYSGNYSYYLSRDAFNNLSGMNNSLNLDYGRVLSRRMSFHVVESLQDLSQNYSLENPALEPGSNLANINISTSPSIQLLNNTIHQSSTQASMTYHQTARLSYDATASYFIIGQTEVGLTGMRGQQFGGDMNYRWTRKATVGAYYSFTNYEYSHNVSHSSSNSAGLIYSYALDRHTQLRTRLGATRIQSRAYETVALPPELAAILGVGDSIVNSSALGWTSDISVQLVRDFGKNRTASVAYAHGESPGNGLLLASVNETATAGFSTSLMRRRVPVSVGIVYSSLQSSLQSNIGFLRSQTAYFTTSRSVGHGVAATFRVDYTRYDVSGVALQQHDLRISVGFGWTPPIDRLVRF